MALETVGKGLVLGLAAWLLSGCGARYERSFPLFGAWQFDGKELQDIDRGSFKPLNDLFARDKHRGYFRGLPVAGSEGASFEALSEEDAKDARHVWRAGTERRGQEYYLIRHVVVTEIAGADPASYRLLGQGYARDRERVYYEGRPFKVRDVESFEPLTRSFARDKVNGYYELQAIAGSHGPSFQMVDERDSHHARDQKRVYHGHIEINDPSGRSPYPVVKVLPGADPATFVLPQQQD